jgi:hypothetical protein
LHQRVFALFDILIKLQLFDYSVLSTNRNAPRDLRIRLGEWDVNRESEFYPHIERDVISVIIHPEYYPGNLYNDIAVIKFEGAVDFGYKYT